MKEMILSSRNLQTCDKKSYYYTGQGKMGAVS